MFVTRPRSLYRKYPGAVSVQPQPDALQSGHLVVTDEDSEALDSFCCGIFKNNQIKKLPFPQDRILQVVHSSLREEASMTKVWFIPILDQPLSSNRYYIIKARGRHKGKAYTCSRDSDTGFCCFNNSLLEDQTRPFDYRDRYQQFEIRSHHSGGFIAKSVEWDGYPPSFLRKGGWEVYTCHSTKLYLREAQGLHISSTSNLPELNFPLHSKRSNPVVLGRWFCPFVFVKEESCSVKKQMQKSLFYELSLKQWWERIYFCENESNGSNIVVFNSRVKRLLCLIQGMEAEKDGGQDPGGFVWFKIKEQFRSRVNVGLSSAIVEKLRWLQETRGWFDGESDVRVSGTKEIESGNKWRKFGCYVLMESLMLRRMDGSLLINFSFRNAHSIECIWE